MKPADHPSALTVPRRNASRAVFTVGFAACLFLLIVGAKWATFDRFGSPIPDWDQWDAEGANLLEPWFNGGPFFAKLFEPHNEHRVVLTKLQNLALTLLNGQWDSRLEAVVNALLHAAIAVACWLVCRRWVAPAWHAALFLLTFALFGLPLAWQNILGGFHSQQYWLLGLSFAAIVTLPFARAGSAAWWAGAAAAILALGSMGSGFLAASVVFALTVWRLLCRATSLRAAWLTLLLTAGVTAVGLITRVEVYYHEQLKVKTAHDFFFSILRSLEWPWRDLDWAGAVLWLPWLLVCGFALAASWRARRHPGNGPQETLKPALLIAALGGWVLIQIVATAYARGAGANYPASRYMDTLTFGAFVNGTALAWLLSRKTPSRLRAFATPLLALAWVFTLGLGLRELLERNLRHELPDAKKYYLNAEGHLRRYLGTDDPKQLAYPDLPYPSAGGLIERLSHARLRASMPLPIRAPVPLAEAAAGKSAGFTKNDPAPAGGEPTRAGLSPGTPPLDFTTSWGSFAAEGGAVGSGAVWQSAALSFPERGWLKFEIAGDVGFAPGVALTLHEAAGGKPLASVVPTKRAGDSWRAAYVPIPRVPFVIRATDDSPAAWLAFSGPVEMRTGSFLAWQAARHGLLVTVGAGGALLVLTGAWLWLRRRPGMGAPLMKDAPHRDQGLDDRATANHGGASGSAG